MHIPNPPKLRNYKPWKDTYGEKGDFEVRDLSIQAHQFNSLSVICSLWGGSAGTKTGSKTPKATIMKGLLNFPGARHTNGEHSIHIATLNFQYNSLILSNVIIFQNEEDDQGKM